MRYSNKDVCLDRDARPDKGHTDRCEACRPGDINTGIAALLIPPTAVDNCLGT